MMEMIDLYAKLLIGTFSFIGPSFTLLIPIFYPAIRKSQRRHNAKRENLQLLIASNLQAGNDFEHQMKTGKNELEKLAKQNRKEIQLLMPKRQVRRLFFSLFSSIMLVGFYYFQKSHFWPYDDLGIRVISIAASAICFAYCIFVLWQIFCTIIRIKSEEKISRRGTVLVKPA